MYCVDTIFRARIFIQKWLLRYVHICVYSKIQKYPKNSLLNKTRHLKQLQNILCEKKKAIEISVFICLQNMCTNYRLIK